MPFIDGFRALAVILVVALHTWQFAGGAGAAFGHAAPNREDQPVHYIQSSDGPAADSGAVGVGLFFILSGFLLSQAWFMAQHGLRPKPNIPSYFRRRFLRIVPAYYFCLGVTLILFVPTLIPPNQVYSWSGAKHVLAHIALLQDFFVSTHFSWNVHGQFWTLSVEALFYVLLPVLIGLFLIKQWTWYALSLVLFSWLWWVEAPSIISACLSTMWPISPFCYQPERRQFARLFIERSFRHSCSSLYAESCSQS